MTRRRVRRCRVRRCEGERCVYPKVEGARFNQTSHLPFRFTRTFSCCLLRTQDPNHCVSFGSNHFGGFSQSLIRLHLRKPNSNLLLYPDDPEMDLSGLTLFSLIIEVVHVLLLAFSVYTLCHVLVAMYTFIFNNIYVLHVERIYRPLRVASQSSDLVPNTLESQDN